MENTPNAGNPTTSADSNAVAIMADLTKKFGSAEEATKAFTLFTAMMEHAKPSSATTATPPPPTIPVILHAEAKPTTRAPEKNEAVGEGQGDEADLAAELVQMAVDDRTTAKVAKVAKVLEGETPVSKQVFVEGETPVSAEGVGGGETLVCDDVVVEGETPVTEGVVTREENPGLFGDLERKTPVVDTVVAERETPDKFVGSEALGVDQLVAEGKTPVYIEGGTPSLSEGVETPTLDEILVPKESGLILVVDLVENSEDTDSPMDKREARLRDKREARLRARRSLRDEIEDLTLPTEEECLAPGTEAPGSSREEGEAEERRLAAERKRKGKNAATSQTKKSRKTSTDKAVETPLPAPTKVPFAKAQVGPSPASESEEEAMDEQEGELNFEPAEVWLTKGLLEAMGKFDDSKRATTYKERSSIGKLAKSGK